MYEVQTVHMDYEWKSQKKTVKVLKGGNTDYSEDVAPLTRLLEEQIESKTTQNHGRLNQIFKVHASAKA